MTHARSFSLLPIRNRVEYEDETLSVQTLTRWGQAQIERGTAFFSVLGPGRLHVSGPVDVPLEAGMYGCAPAPVELSGEALHAACVVTIKGYTGLFQIGGPIEATGRLRYIDGCTDTGIVAPLKCGDPCLNCLFFPARTVQTPHTHPSHRVGLIVDGRGYCLTEGRRIEMAPGAIFLLPPDVVHSFETDDEPMRIIVAHPDSDIGPTDEVHQMKRATILAATGQPAA
jgi:mannose-6-phosphate isomerase-like protein (cupin superfamily)